MDFQYALTALKEGRRVERSGWNGKGMSIFLFKGNEDDGPPCQARPGWLKTPEAKLVLLGPHIVMQTVQGTYIPWLASQTDLLADDWSIVG